MKKFTYPSSSSDSVHTVTLFDDGRIVCTCRGFRAPSKCWHVRKVAEENPASCLYCQTYFASHTCNRGIGECDCPPCQGVCGCAPRAAVVTVPYNTAGAQGFVKPMLAMPLPDNFAITPGAYAVSEKIDGHRWILHRDAEADTVTFWSRAGKVQDEVPEHIVSAARKLPFSCTLDGEAYVPGGQFSHVKDLRYVKQRVYMVFDILSLLGQDTTKETYDRRQSYLIEIFSRELTGNAIQLVESVNVSSMADIYRLRDAVWDKPNGEGLIVKRRAAVYQPGKRSKDFLKVKKLESGVLTITGFNAGKGEIVSRGAHAAVCLVDDNGLTTTCKTLDDAMLARFNANPASFIGRRIRIDYTEIKDGAYRNPRIDRLEDE